MTATDDRRMESTLKPPVSRPQKKLIGKEHSINHIAVDLPRTFPALAFFQVCVGSICASFFSQAQYLCLWRGVWCGVWRVSVGVNRKKAN